MSRDDLREMFADLAADVSRAELARAAVAGAARIRRRRRVVAGASAVMLASALAAVAWWSPVGPPPAVTTTPTATARPSGAIRSDLVPYTIRTEADAVPYWPGSLQPPVDAPSLADAPLSHATVLVMPFREQPRRMYVYGEGLVNGGSGSGTFHWARLDVDLATTGENAVGFPMDRNSLGPMGRHAAFPQPDAVVVVDIRTGAVDRIAAPGPNRQVTWLPDGNHVLVSSEARTWLINITTRTRVEAAVPGYAVTPLVGGATGLTALTRGEGDGPPVLRRYDDAGLAERDSHVVDDTPARPYSLAILLGRGWRYGNLIAHTATARPGGASADVVAVIDDRTAVVTHVLALAGAKERFGRGCCTVVGWAGAGDDVLIGGIEGLLRWRLSTGEVTRLSDPGFVIVSVAPMGCDWTITVNRVTASCTT
jgi:hypothetical protein